MIKYADDTVIYYSHKNIQNIGENLQNNFNNFNKWFEENELIINSKVGKTETMIFGTGKKLSLTKNISLMIKHQGITRNQTNNYKYLGLSLNSTISFTLDRYFDLRASILNFAHSSLLPNIFVPLQII